MLVRIEGYLVQRKLEAALKAIVGEPSWLGSEVRIPALRGHRWDMMFRSSHGPVAVEFDGDNHYCDSLRIRADRRKDALAAEEGLAVVRVPYWVQLTTETLGHYLGLDAEIVQDFPHGFITSKVFPASYCELGLDRFEAELMSLSEGVRQAVVKSLRDRAQEHGQEFVVTRRLASLL